MDKASPRPGVAGPHYSVVGGLYCHGPYWWKLHLILLCLFACLGIELGVMPDAVTQSPSSCWVAVGELLIFVCAIMYIAMRLDVGSLMQGHTWPGW